MPKRMKRALAAGVGAAALLASVTSPGIAAPAAPAAEPSSSAAVRVNFQASQGRLLHTEHLNNFGNPVMFAEQRPADVKFLNDQGLHSDIQRVWMDDDPTENTGYSQLCDLATKKCDFSLVDGYLRDASELSDSLLLVVLARTYIVAKQPAQSKAMLKLIIKGLKERYPKIEYIEAFNEPDHKFYGAQLRAGETPIMQPEELYAYYVPVYEAVNEVNRELHPKVALKVGGPAFGSLMNERWMKAFLDGYAADPNPHKRLDFISTHSYGEFSDDFQSFHVFKQDPSELATHRARLDQLLADRGISTKIPAFITETGIYPGPSFDEREGVGDYLRQAAGVASQHYWFSNQPNTYAFNWVVRHRDGETRKNQLVPGQPGQPVPPATLTPYGNMMLMQSKMKDTRVAAVSDSLHEGQGVYAVASKDKTGAALMVWNYQHINERSFQTTIDMENLPANLRNGPVRQRMYRIDQTTSNYFTNPAKADLQLVDQRIVKPGRAYTQSIDLTPNAIYLILLDPA